MDFKYANVQLHGSAIRYCFWTNILDLKKNDLVLVESVIGIKTAIFTDYATDERTCAKATKWILTKLDAERIKSNLMIELEEEGIPISPIINKKKVLNEKDFENIKKWLNQKETEKLIKELLLDVNI